MKNNTQAFKPNRLKNVLLFLVCSVFVAIAILMLPEKPLIGWLSILLFGIGVLVSIIQFLPNAAYLKLNDDGFEVKSLFRSHFTQWSNVQSFSLGHINGNKMIFFNFTEEHKKWRNGKKLSKFLSGKEGAIPSSYTISSDELLQLMKEYKRKSELNNFKT